MNEWTLGIDGKFRRYEVFVEGEWKHVWLWSLPVFRNKMRGYRVIEYSPYGETITKTFLIQ